MNEYIVRTKKWPGQTLRPVLNFLDGLYPSGISLKELGERIGMSPKNVSQVFMSDNAHLSKLEAMAKQLGYTLRLTYDFDHRENAILSLNYEFPNAGNLYGIVDYCNENGISLNSVAKKSRIERATIVRALKHGDIMVAVLEQIALFTGLKIRWHFDRIDNQK